MESINIDDFVDYKKEYSSRLQKLKHLNGDEYQALCPVHNEKNPSCSFNFKTGKWHCHSCDAQGNYITFRVMTEHISKQEALKRIFEDYDKELPQAEIKKKQTPTTSNPVSYTVKEYALEKKLPLEWLLENCKLENGKDKNGNGFVTIPYWDINGQPVKNNNGWIVNRKRYPKGVTPKLKWSNGAAGHTLLYGEWKIPHFLEHGDYAILPEGESDTHTLWYLGFNAIGVPGASMMKLEWAKKLNDFSRIYLHIEPDNGGQVFLRKTVERLKEAEYNGEVFVLNCAQFNVKDPSDLYIKYGAEEALKKLNLAIKNAEKIDIYSKVSAVTGGIDDAPINLNAPPGWRYDDKGITYFNPKKEGDPELVCRTPIVLTKRLHSLDTGEEKIEVSFKRDGKWTSRIFQRSTIFQSRNIVMLADMGCTITSENSRLVVRFLGALEAENIDVLQKIDSTSTFGWQSGKRFLPGCADDIVIDVEPAMMKWVAGFGEHGELTDWIEQMREARKNSVFRFILASAFAAPLLKITHCRNFMVYNWADSKGGKTATLKAGLSVWGNPEQIMASFNATQVALERMAGIFNDLPMGLDERQLAGSKTEFIEKIVYMLGNGTGRIRGSKTGQLQQLQTWRSIIMATGEEPIINDRSMDGISSRMLEIGASPFDDVLDAANMHNATAENYGWAGPEFIRKLLNDWDEDTILFWYKDIQNRIKELYPKMDNNKIAMVALVTLADSLSEIFFWEDKSMELAVGESVFIAANVIEVMTAQDTKSSTNANSAEFINEWLAMKASNFSGTPSDCKEWYGAIDEDLGKAYVLGTVLHDALEKAGYNHRKTMKYLAEQEIISRDSQGKMTIRKSIGNRVFRLVEIHLDKLVDDEPEKKEQPKKAENEQQSSIFTGSTKVIEDDLPF